MQQLIAVYKKEGDELRIINDYLPAYGSGLLFCCTLERFPLK